MKGILILSTNESFAFRLILCLLNLKIRMCVMGISKFHPIRFSRYCNHYHNYRYSDLLEENENFIKEIDDYCIKQKLDLIIPTGIDSTLFLSKMKEKIKCAKIFPISDFETLKMLNNKWTFTEMIKKNNLPYPKTILIKEIKDISQVKFSDLEFPVIIKPLDLEGGKGLFKLNTYEELESFTLNRIGDNRINDRIGDNRINDRINDKNKFNRFPFIIQEYIPGKDVDISILAKDGNILAWTIQKWQGKKEIEFIKNDNMLDIGRTITSHCKFDGVAHIDMMIDNRDNSVKVLECNPRFWGSLEQSMMSGVNFPYLGILSSQNEKLPDINYKTIRYIEPQVLISRLLKNLSLKNMENLKKTYIDNADHNLHFVHKMMDDPIYYFGLIGYKILLIILELADNCFINIRHKLNWKVKKI